MTSNGDLLEQTIMMNEINDGSWLKTRFHSDRAVAPTGYFTEKPDERQIDTVHSNETYFHLPNPGHHQQAGMQEENPLRELNLSFSMPGCSLINWNENVNPAFNENVEILMDHQTKEVVPSEQHEKEKTSKPRKRSRGGKNLKLMGHVNLTFEEKIKMVESMQCFKKLKTGKATEDALDGKDDSDESDGESNDSSFPKGFPFDRYCFICERMYADHGYFRQHCRDIHNICSGSQKKEIACNYCGSTFSDSESDNYKNHEKSAKHDVIYCIKKKEVMKKSSRANSKKNFKNVSAIDLQLQRQKKKESCSD